MFDETLNGYPHKKTFKKEDNRVFWMSNSRQLNKVIRRKQYPLPIITDILRKRSRYNLFAKLDVSMPYYMFELDNKSQDSCTIITPFGKYKYLRLPMGLKCSPDIAQAIMELSDNRRRIHMIDMISYDMNSHDEKSYDMSSHDENSYDVNSYDIMKSYIQ
jgi:hypothetical protein